jgi:long-chain-fatty-acid--[acyl-carrier-protein] ligase
MGLVLWVVRLLLSLRYRIKSIGLDRVEKGGGILFLPNHPAEIDPVIVLGLLWGKFCPAPVVVENFYELPLIKLGMKGVGALPIPDLDGSTNRWKMKQADKAARAVAERLKAGKNVLLYPSGRLKNSAEEQIGGASMVHTLVQEIPDLKIVLVRTTGLWGSQFSRALTGASPSPAKIVMSGLKTVLKNGIFFVPKRKVEVEFFSAPEELRAARTRQEFNQLLEEWYNKKPDPLNQVSLSFWKEEFPALEKKKAAVSTRVAVPEEIQNAILKKVADVAEKDRAAISAETHLMQDLGLDSLDMAQLYLFLEEKYGVVGLMPSQLQTVADLMQHAANPPQIEGAIHTQKKGWKQERARPLIEIPEGSTIQEVFLKSCKRMGRLAAASDTSGAVISYRRLKMAACAFAEQIKTFEGEYVGILLPATIGAQVVVLATLLAGKIPVMLNWTMGSRVLDHIGGVCKLRSVITSRRFLNQLPDIDVGTLDDSLVFVEAMRKRVKLKHKIAALFRQPKKGDGDKTAVVLFTSGTENVPKGVPLSHQNILSNQRSALSCVSFNPSDVLLGCLPPFHSFGFSVSGLLPLVSGLRVHYSPDPSDSSALCHAIKQWKVSLVCSAPSFLKQIFRSAKPGQLETVRLFVSGAEKTPADLFEATTKMGAQLIEGYGITECSPIVTLDRPDLPHKGVGHPLPGLDLLILNGEQTGAVPGGEEGEICISGPSVFNGYLDTPHNPFIVHEGKRYYRSGDRGKIDFDGTVILTGRLKRFVKIGGEMVSLAGLEEEIGKILNLSSSEGPAVAITAREGGGEKSQIILFTTLDISKEDLNLKLRESGYGRIVKISEVCKVEQIPLTGTGKTNYRLLDEKALSI